MGWARLDDQRTSNMKLLLAGFAPRGLDEAAICLCARDETDGFVSDDALEWLARVHSSTIKQVQQLAARLVEVGRWQRDEERGGHWLHDYLEYNPSHEQEEERRESARLRKAKSRAKVDHSESGQFTPVSHGGHSVSLNSHGVTPPRPSQRVTEQSHRDTPDRHGVTPASVTEPSPVARPDPSRPVVSNLSSSSKSLYARLDDDDDDEPIGNGRKPPRGPTAEALDRYRAACRLLAEADLGRRIAEVGSVGDAESWLAKATETRYQRHFTAGAGIENLATMDAAAAAAVLDPPPLSAATAHVRRGDQAECTTCGQRGGAGWVTNADGFAEPCPACGTKRATA
jgi:hypothetical protein